MHLKDSLIQECNTSQCHARPVVIYSNMTHFTVGHFDEVSVHSNGDTGDSKWTGAWKMATYKMAETRTAKRLAKKRLGNPDNPPIVSIRH